MSPRYTDMQLDALRELANIASGTAATALSQMLGREVELNVPRALALPLADAVEAAGAPDETVSGVVIPLEGDIEGLVLLLIPSDSAHSLCRLLGVEAGSEVGDSALSEIGNILGASYLNALAAMTGSPSGPAPPLEHRPARRDRRLAAGGTAGAADTALVMDSELDVAGEPCKISFLLLPTAGGAVDLLTPLGLIETAA